MGSGISAVQGNVVDVELEGSSEADGFLAEGTGGAEAGLSEVHVSIDEAGVETFTDVDGFFSLEGSFGGSVTVRFSDPATGDSLGTVPIDVAPGSTVFLPDVEIRRDLFATPENAVIVHAARHLNLRGTLESVDCVGGVIGVSTNDGAGARFVLHLSETSELVDREGDALACDRLAPGTTVVLEEGIVNIDVGDEAIRVVRMAADGRGGPPVHQEFRVRRQGVVVRSECERGEFLHLWDRDNRDLVRVELRPETRVLCAGRVECGCTDISFGQFVDAEAIRNVGSPSSLVAEQVMVGPNPGGSVRWVLNGDIAGINCAEGTATIVDRRLGMPLRGEALPPPLEVSLAPGTVYSCRNVDGDDCTCEDIGKGYRVKIETELRQAGAPPRAVTVTVIAVPRVSVRGTVQWGNCDAGMMMLETTGEQSGMIAISAATVIHASSGMHMSCSDLRWGEEITVRGELFRRDDLPTPIIIAEEIQVRDSHMAPGSGMP